MICASCGRESEHAICGRCLAKREKLIRHPGVVEIISCPKCGRFKFSGKWVEIEFEEALDKAISSSFYVHPEYEVRDIEFDGDGHFYRFKAKGIVRGDYVDQEGFFEVKVKKETCQKCSREAGGYYEAIIQLRAKNRSLLEEEIRRVSEIISEEISSSGSERSFLTKVEERKEGLDFYIGDSKVAKKVARRIVREMGAEFKESPKIAGRKDGVDVYRMTYLVRLPEYFPGDVVLSNGKIVVAKINKGYDVLTGESVPLENVRVLVRRSELRKGYVVSEDDYAIEVLSGEEVYAVEKPSYGIGIGEEVFLAVINDKAYAIPKWMVE